MSAQLGDPPPEARERGRRADTGHSRDRHGTAGVDPELKLQFRRLRAGRPGKCARLAAVGPQQHCASPAADQVRVSHQPKSRKGARPYRAIDAVAP